MHYDSHVHSAASPDSELNPVDAIIALKSKGLGVVFTEHADFATPITGKDPSATDAPKSLSDFICDFDIYPSQYRGIKQKYGSDSVLLGIEIGLSAAYLPLNSQIADNDYDFVLGAIHYVDGHDVFHDAAKMQPREFCRRYLTYGKEVVELSGFFDALAHIDYIARYSDNIDKLFKYENFPKEFDDLLQVLADRELALEINTRRIGNNKAVRHLLPIYKRFNELGGKYVTIGSDAHKIEGLGRHYAKALDMAKMANLTPVFYSGRKRFNC